METKKRVDWIDTLKGITFFLVVLGHTDFIDRTLKSFIYSFHMPLFLILTAITINYTKILNQSFSEYFIKNVKRLLIPYAWLQLISISLRIIQKMYISGGKVHIARYILGATISNSRIVGDASLPMYYITLLFLTNIFIWLTIRLARGKKWVMVLILTITIILSVLFDHMNMPWHLNVVPTALTIVYITNFLYKGLPSFTYNKVVYAIAPIILLVLGVASWKINGRISLFAVSYGKNYFLFLLSCFCTSSALIMIVSKLPTIKFLNYIGKNTLIGLGLHLPILDIITALAQRAQFSQSSDWWFVLLSAVLVFLLIIPLSMFANKFAPYLNGRPLVFNGYKTSIGLYVSLIAATALPATVAFGKVFGAEYRLIIALVWLVVIVVIERVFTLLLKRKA